MKGGREAARSNAALHAVVRAAVVAAAPDAAAAADLEHAVSLLPDRDAVARLLAACDAAASPLVDLVVPRGSNALVKHVQASTKVPVLGHADGVCHVYVDASADASKAVALCVDAKCDYPAARGARAGKIRNTSFCGVGAYAGSICLRRRQIAGHMPAASVNCRRPPSSKDVRRCNAAETFLFHESTVASGLAKTVADALREAGVELAGSPAAVEAGLASAETTKPPRHEHGCLAARVEVVSGVTEAVAFVNAHSSGHTDLVVAEDSAAAETFLRTVDSADIFHNASTRFADGFRFGLGAELGIATGRIHARGPVGVDGFLTYKWLLRSSDVHRVADFAGDAPAKRRVRRADPASRREIAATPRPRTFLRRVAATPRPRRG